jgi:hypothetical protein
MSQRTADIRDVALLTVAALVGAFMLAALPVVGVPLEAAALATLAYRFRERTAWVVVAATIAVWALVSWPTALVVVAPILIAAGPLSARALKDRPALFVATFIGAVVLAVTAASLALEAEATGKTLIAYLNSEMATTLDTLMKGAASGGTASGLDPIALRNQMLMLLPGWFIVTSALSGVLGTVAIAWAGLKAGVTTQRLPRITELQVSTYALVPIIVGLGSLAVGRFSDGTTAFVLTMIGANLLVVSIPLLTAQGLGILLFWLNRLSMPRWGRIAATVGALVIEPILPLMTLAGLMDTWLNFRRLPRDPQPDEAPAERRY